MQFRDSLLTILVLSIIGVGLVALGFGVGLAAPHGKPWQREAVLKGHAIWAVDKDGAPVFQWKSEGAKK